MYGYVRGRQLEGTYPGSPATGVWPSSTLRIMKGWGSVGEKDWPYDGKAEHWPPTEPPDLDQKAKEHRILAYERVRSVKDCLILLSAELPVSASFEIDDSWSKSQDGVIPSPVGRPVTGNHAILLVGYDKEKRTFIFRNSWGASWGKSGYGYLPFKYFSSRLLEAWVIPVPDCTPRLLMPANGKPIRTWGIVDPLGGVLHGIEVFDPAIDELIGWAFAVERDSFLDVEELFVRPDWRKRGYGSQLTLELTILSQRLSRNLRAWVAHSDAKSLRSSAFVTVLRRLGLNQYASPVRWSLSVCTAIKGGT